MRFFRKNGKVYPYFLCGSPEAPSWKFLNGHTIKLHDSQQRKFGDIEKLLDKALSTLRFTGTVQTHRAGKVPSHM